MIKIKYFGWDIRTLQYDLGPGEVLKTMNDTKKVSGLTFKSIWDALRYVSTKCLGTAYHKYDWNFEQCLDENNNDGWVLHIIVDKHNKFANEKMIDDWKNTKLGLFDLLVNVCIEET